MGPTEDQSHVSSQIKGTPVYLDPAYCMSFHLSPFSDVYSFGVILLQLVSARPAVYTNGNPSNYHIIEWARPCLERGNIEEILDVNLLSEPCNMEMMLKMGQLGLRCAVKVPKQRPTMNQVLLELEEALHSVDNFISRQPSSGASYQSTDLYRSMDNDHSQSFVSIDGVGFQRFHVDMDSFSMQSTSLRRLEENSRH
uniref:Protein kinase domain-containing protein n=1 Tax=Fagus sylvatica TaxID=28930 RepID=A0A2N9I215_FAGSY